MVPADPFRAPKKPRRVATTQCRTEIATCPVCAGQHYYYVRRILWVAGWFGGHCQVTRKTRIRCDACDGTGTIVRHTS